MELKNYSIAGNKDFFVKLLNWINLRPEESKRTLLMLACYTVISIGLRWVEDSALALFLHEFQSEFIPWIYIASAVVGAVFIFFYSWLQQIWPLRFVIVAIVPCMVIPLVLFVSPHWGLQGTQVAVAGTFMLRLWVEAIYTLNDLNTSIAANQLFNIREIKRAYPLVKSGILVADVISGYSLPLLVQFLKLDKIILLGALFIIFGGVILRYLSQAYPQAFADPPQRLIKKTEHKNRHRLKGPLRRYALLLFTFIGLIQVIGVLIDVQYLTQIQSHFQEKDIAKFLGLFNATAGLCQLVMQWFFSSRFLERFGVFVSISTLPLLAAFLLPITIPLLDLFPPTRAQNFFLGLIIFKFFDDLLRYTFVASGGPLLFQPIPDKVRNRLQTLLGGIAEPIATCFASVMILVTIWLTSSLVPKPLQNMILIAEIVVTAIVCLGVILILRKGYVDLLVISAGKGQLFSTDIDLRVFRQAVIKALGEQNTLADKQSCIELLSQIDPKGAGEILAPLLMKLPATLQSQSLEVMLNAGASEAYLPYVQALLHQPKENVTPEVFALALRYLWLSDTKLNLSQLEDFLQPQQHSIIRATLAALLLRHGTPMQKVCATKTLNKMLTHPEEQERVDGVKALSEALHLQALRIHIPNLLQDESLKVRQAVLSMIASNHLEEYYLALLAGLEQKSTRNSAMQALVRLENEAIPMLVELGTNVQSPDVVRMYAWRTIGQIGTVEAVDNLWLCLENSWGTTRVYILRTLLKIHRQTDILSLVDMFHETRVQKLIEEELQFLGKIYAAYVDFKNQTLMYADYICLKISQSADEEILKDKILSVSELLQRSLIELEIDIKERLILILKLLYPLDKIQAAAFNLQSDSVGTHGRGLEILEHTITLPKKIKLALLTILDNQPLSDKFNILVEAKIVDNEQIVLSERTRELLSLENSLSDWCLACCFHFAIVGRVRLSIPQILTSLLHPTGFVREAAFAYLSVASPKVLLDLLPQLEKDSHPIIKAAVKELVSKYK